MGSMVGYLSVTRERSISNALRSFTMLVDDKTVDKIKPGETKRYALPSGRHVIRVKIDLYKSKPLKLNLRSGETVNLLCGDQAPKTLSESFSLRGMGQSLKAVTSPSDYLRIEVTGRKNSRKTTPPSPTKRPQSQPEASGKRAVSHRTIFLSYRREDSRAFTGRIYDRLSAHFGQSAVFRDVDSIPVGMDFRSKINESIDRADLFVAIIGPRWSNARNAQGERRLDLAGDYVRLEIETAMAKGVPIIPLLVDNAQMPQADELPDSLASLVFRNALPIPHEPYFHAGIDLLIDQIGELEIEPQAPRSRFCVDCGKPLQTAQRFCTGCGRPTDHS